MTATTSPAAVIRRFIEACDEANREAMATCLAPDVVAGVTQPDASTAELTGRDAYLAAIDALDLPTVRPSIKAIQIVEVSADQAMAMIEIRAQRKGRTLHNFTGQLMTVTNGLIRRIWMVEALPAESDEFWKA
ncbi:MAG: nuclear transport factor 2 family protein [Verrucomicrobiota bacterium]